MREHLKLFFCINQFTVKASIKYHLHLFSEREKKIRENTITQKNHLFESVLSRAFYFY